MNFYDIIDKIETIAGNYTGKKPLGFGYGVSTELNAIPDKTLPMVYVLTDPEFVSISPNYRNNSKAITFIFLVLDEQKLDATAAETRELQDILQPICDGIGYRLYQDEDLTVEASDNTLRLKKFDEVLTGIGCRMTITVADTATDYPFECNA